MSTTDSSQSHNDSSQRRKNLPPWTRVVRGEPNALSSIVTEEQSSFSDCDASKVAPMSSLVDDFAVTESPDDNAGAQKKVAWTKASNGVVDKVSPVLGADSWPALSESTKAGPKSSPAEYSSKTASDEPMADSQEPVIPASSHKQATSNPKHNSTSNHLLPARQRFLKRGGGGGGSVGGHSQGSFTHSPLLPQPPPPPPFPFPMHPNGFGNPVSPMRDQFPRDPFRGNNREPRPVGSFGPRPQMVNGHRPSYRRGNFGPWGGGPYHNNIGGRLEQDHGYYGNFRGGGVQPQRAYTRSFVRSSPPNTTTFPPQPAISFADPICFPDMACMPTLPLELFREAPPPFISHAPAPGMFPPVPEPTLPAMLVHQIEYYFSDANLVKDHFLKSNMDDEGWVPITLIAGFNRVKKMTNDIQFILDSLMVSTIIEVQDNKVRRRNDWKKWIPAGRLPTISGLQSSTSSSHDTLTTSLRNIALKEVAGSQNSMTMKSSPHSDVSKHSTELRTPSHISQQESPEGTSSSRN